MTKLQMANAKRIIRKFYQLKTPVTDMQVRMEVANLRRRGNGNLDDRQGYLAASLEIGKHGIVIFED